MLLAQGFAMVDAIPLVAAVLAALDAAVVPALVQAVLMLEHKDAVAVLDLALGSALDAPRVLPLVLADAMEHAVGLVGSPVVHQVATGLAVVAQDAVHAEELAMVAIAVQAVVLLLVVAAAQVARPVVDAVVATAVKDAVVVVNLRAAVHAGLLLSNFYI